MSRFVWAMLLFVMFNGIFPASASTISESAENREIAAEDLDKPVASQSANSAKDMSEGAWAGPNGVHRWLKFGKYLWRVLNVYDNEGQKVAFLLAEEEVAKRPFYPTMDDNDWKNSDIKKWLNGDFYDSAFTEGEKSAILTTNYRYGGEYEGNNKTDSSKIFLLSVEEAMDDEYFAHDDDRHHASWWWLRSPGGNGTNAAIVCNVGKVYIYGFYAYLHGGVRPALSLDLSSPIFKSPSSGNEILYKQP